MILVYDLTLSFCLKFHKIVPANLIIFHTIETLPCSFSATSTSLLKNSPLSSLCSTSMLRFMLIIQSLYSLKLTLLPYYYDGGSYDSSYHSVVGSNSVVYLNVFWQVLPHKYSY